MGVKRYFEVGVTVLDLDCVQAVEKSAGDIAEMVEHPRYRIHGTFGRLDCVEVPGDTAKSVPCEMFVAAWKEWLDIKLAKMLLVTRDGAVDQIVGVDHGGGV